MRLRARLAGARVDARQQGARAAGHRRGVPRHPVVHLFELERAGHVLDGALEAQLVASASPLPVELAGALERQRRELGQCAERSQVVGTEWQGLVERGRRQHPLRLAGLARDGARDDRGAGGGLPGVDVRYEQRASALERRNGYGRERVAQALVGVPAGGGLEELTLRVERDEDDRVDRQERAHAADQARERALAPRRLGGARRGGRREVRLNHELSPVLGTL